jgi:hypothetical protein
MTRRHDTRSSKPPYAASVWTAIVLMGFLLCAFGIVSLMLTHNHTWTDKLLSCIPAPGSRTSLAADRGLINQMHTKRASARVARLSDRQPTLVVEAQVSNDSLIPVTKIVIQATAYADGNPLSTRSSHCGRVVSERLFSRMRGEELNVLLDIETPASEATMPGDEITCQVTLSGRAATEAEEIGVRIASVEPLPGHRFPRFASSE